MVRFIKDGTALDQKNRATLLLMKPGVWYCFTDYAGCHPVPQCETHITNRLLQSLAEKGYIESTPVFEGFLTEKHRITSEGIAWLRTF